VRTQALSGAIMPVGPLGVGDGLAGDAADGLPGVHDVRLDGDRARFDLDTVRSLWPSWSRSIAAAL